MPWMVFFIRYSGLLLENQILRKAFGHFVQSLKFVDLRTLDALISSDVVSLFTNVPVNEALQVIRNKLHNDNTLAELSCRLKLSWNCWKFENHIFSGE
jgi:hypothetical protein